MLNNIVTYNAFNKSLIYSNIKNNSTKCIVLNIKFVVLYDII